MALSIIFLLIALIVGVFTTGPMFALYIFLFVAFIAVTVATIALVRYFRLQWKKYKDEIMQDVNRSR